MKLRITTTDGPSKVRSFSTLTGARKFVRHQLGRFEVGTGYLVGEFGDCKITVVEGCTPADLARDDAEAPVGPQMGMECTVHLDLRTVPPVPYAANRFRVYSCTPRRGGRDEILGQHSELKGTSETWQDALKLNDRLQARADDEEIIEIRRVATYPAAYGVLGGQWGYETVCYSNPDAVTPPVELTDSEIPF